MDWAPKSKLRAAYRDMALALATGESTEETSDENQPDEPQRKGLFSLFAGQKA